MKVFVTGALGFIGRALVERSRAGGAKVSGMEGEVSGGTDMGTVRWDRVAEGLGCAGFHVERLEELEPALARAKSAGGPAVVCVRTSRDANLSLPIEALQRFTEVYQGPLG